MKNAMLLSDHDIESEIQRGRLAVAPYNPGNLQPASLDVTLDSRFLRFHSRQPLPEAGIDPTQPDPGLLEHTDIGHEGVFVLRPNEFALGATVECITLPDHVAARLEGKSSLGRIGLMIHSTAGFVDPGWHGQLTLELSNCAPFPIRLRYGMKIGQLSFVRLSSPCRHPYGSARLGSRYQGQTGPTPSRPEIVTQVAA